MEREVVQSAMKKKGTENGEKRQSQDVDVKVYDGGSGGHRRSSGDE
jgi:hypothetical protein